MDYPPVFRDYPTFFDISVVSISNGWEKGEIMPTTLLLTPRVFRPSYGPVAGFANRKK